MAPGLAWYRRSVKSCFWAVGLVFALSLGACDGCHAASSGKTKVAVSIFPLYDLVRRVAGPDAETILVLPPGHTEHSFDPSPKDVEQVASAKVGVLVGLGLDPWMEKLMKDAAPKAALLKVGERVKTLTVKEGAIGDEAADKARTTPEEDHDHELGATDPHVWMDPSRARTMVAAVGDELAKADPVHAEGYKSRAKQVDGELDKLDQELMARTGAFKTRGFVTFHGSFNYFADRYKLKILAVIEPFPGSSPTGEYIQEVLKVVQERKVPALFSEPQLDPRPAKTIAEAAKIPLGTLDPVGGTSETDSYEKLLRFDVDSLEKFLK
jgi:ABC-type Zn uptake system ZnuABC Zn-binding protein ZnuA